MHVHSTTAADRRLGLPSGCSPPWEYGIRRMRGFVDKIISTKPYDWQVKLQRSCFSNVNKLVFIPFLGTQKENPHSTVHVQP